MEKSIFKVGDKILYRVDGVVEEVECEVIEAYGSYRYKIKDEYGYEYVRFINYAKKL